jgi:hypothetical protein
MLTLIRAAIMYCASQLCVCLVGFVSVELSHMFVCAICTRLLVCSGIIEDPMRVAGSSEDGAVAGAIAGKVCESSYSCPAVCRHCFLVS